MRFLTGGLVFQSPVWGSLWGLFGVELEPCGIRAPLHQPGADGTTWLWRSAGAGAGRGLPSTSSTAGLHLCLSGKHKGMG